MNLDKIKELIEAQGYIVDYKATTRGNGIMIGKHEQNIHPVLYYERMDLAGKSDEEIANHLIEVAIKNMRDDDFDVNSIMKWDIVKDNLKLCVRSSNTRSDEVVIDRFYDIDKYVRVIVHMPFTDDDSMASVAVTYGMLEQFGVTKEELFEQALKCTHDTYIINDMRSVMAAMFGGELPEDLEIPPEMSMTVLTTVDKMHGASVIFDNEILSKVAHSIGDADFYILPSSIHEVLVVAVTDDTNAAKLRDMVHDVNENEVAPEERLSYSVFYYDHEAEMVRKAG